MRDTVAVWLGGLDGTTWWEQDADEPVYAASLVKVPIGVAAGRLDLDARVPVHADFDSAVPGERFVLREEDDQDPATWAELGTTQTLRELRRRAIVHSGNLAADLVLEAVLEEGGPDAVRDLLPGVCRAIGDQPAADAGITNLVTARGLGGLLGRLPREMEDVMLGQTYRDGIPAGLPAGTRIANKTGWVDDHTHDVAVVRPADGEPFALAVLTRLAGVATEAGNAHIAAVARDAWERRR
jgi:beta-lactamase class A